MTNYDIIRGSDIIVTVKPTGKRSRKMMDVNQVNMSFTLNEAINFMIGDYIMVAGERYTIKAPHLPAMTKESSIKYSYQLLFKNKAADLIEPAYLQLDADNKFTIATFDLMGNADTFIDLLILNANRDQSGWVKGTVDETPFINQPFANENCLSVLSTLATTYNLEWWVDGQTIHMTKKGVNENLKLRYGKGNGLYTIGRTTVTDRNIVTRLYAYGSEQNLPANYKGYSKHLKLPGDTPYIMGNTAKYGIVERSVSFDDIRPERKGVVTNTSDAYTFTDAAMDFDVNDCLLPGVTAKAAFNTGQLAGYQFEITNYNAATKTFRIKQNQDEKALVLPSDLLRPAVGDEFVLIDMKMPQVYIDNAEQRLLVRAQQYLADNSEPMVVYNVACDKQHFRRNNITINLGNYIKVIDEEFNLDSYIRITADEQDLQNLYDHNLDLQQVVSVSQVMRNYEAYSAIKSAVRINRLNDVARSRMSWLQAQELRDKIYDVDGYFDAGNIKPLSIETAMLSAGARSQQFALQGVMMSANYEGTANKFYTSAGSLVHFTLADSPVTWQIPEKVIAGLEPQQAYYIYVKCDKSTDQGEVILSASVIATAAVAGYYHFWVGVLHSAIDGVRGISLTYGQTTINGRFIKTGRVEGNGAYFDLDEGEIGGKIAFASGSSGYDNLTDKPNLDVFALNSYVEGIRSELQSQIDGAITSWFYNYEPTLTNEPASLWATDEVKDKHLGDLFYWTSKGYAYRYAKQAQVYSWLPVADTDIVLALQKAKDAQDTADGKRRTFIVQPFTPYDVGDLWTDGTQLMRCEASRSSGAFNANDWTAATNHDNTKTVIDGGLITSGAVVLGDENGQWAGISGSVVDYNSVLIWAGSNFAGRFTADFRVTITGRVTMKNADVQGKITATSGKIGAWNITEDGGISNDDGTAFVLAKQLGNGGKVSAGIGTNVFDVDSVVLPAGTKGVAFFENSVVNSGINVALYCKAHNGSQNYAAYFEGPVRIRGVYGSQNVANLTIDGLPGGGESGKQYLLWDYTTGRIYAKND